MRGLGFEPRNPYGTGPSTVPVINYKSIRDDFSKWLFSRVSMKYAWTIIRYLDKYVGDRLITTPKEMWEIRESATSKKNITLALRNLVNYYE